MSVSGMRGKKKVRRREGEGERKKEGRGPLLCEIIFEYLPARQGGSVDVIMAQGFRGNP